MTLAVTTLLDSLNDGLLVIDSAGQITLANRAAREMLHLTDDPTGELLEDVIPEAPPPETMGDLPVAFEMTLPDDRYIEVLISVLPAESGRALTLRDVTVQRHRERSLMTNERRYRALFENMSDAVLILDNKGQILVAGPRSADMFGLPLDEVLKHTFFSFIPPEDCETIQRCIDHVFTGKTLPLFEQDFIRGDIRFPAEVVMTLVRDIDHNPSHVQVLLRDISERKWVETNLQRRVAELAILQRVDDEINRSLSINTVLKVALDAAMTHSDADAGYIAVLEPESETVRIEAIAGAYSPKRKGEVLRYNRGIVGRVLQRHEPEYVLDVSQDDDYEIVLEATQAVMVLPLISGEQLIGVLVLETSEPQYFNEETRAFMDMLAGRIAIALENARLFSYVQQELEEIETLYEEKSHLEQLKTDMIRIASHDLKNPLSIVAAYVNMLNDDRAQFDDMYHIYFEEMQAAIDRQWAILEDVLSMERIQQRALGDNISMINLSHLVDFTAQEYRSQAERKNHHYILQIQQKDPPLMVMGDEVQLREAIGNLLVNAIKYTPQHGTINVSLLEERGKARFMVKDTGFGIPEKRQDQLFEPFYRAKADGTENIDGTGLGLYLVKNIVERHNGEIIFESAYQKGSTFGFYLPLATG